MNRFTGMWITFTLAAILATPAATADQPAACEQASGEVLRGFTVRTSLGPAIWFGQVGQHSDPGMAFSFGAGYEWLSYLATELHWTSGFHNTDQEQPPAPGAFTTQALHAGLRFTLPLDRFDLFARGGVGLQWNRPDILVRIEEFDGESRLAWMAGLGFSWHTPRKHFWLGLEASVLGAVDFPGYLVGISALVGLTLF